MLWMRQFQSSRCGVRADSGAHRYGSLRERWLVVALVVGLGFATGACPVLAEGEPKPSPNASRSEQEVAAQIDSRLSQSWERQKLIPAERTTDAEFLRRLHLDLTGTIPTVHAVRSFLADADPHKRTAVVERIVRHPRHALHLANIWRDVMIRRDNAQFAFNSNQFHGWLRDQFAQNVGYDKLARSILTASGQVNQSGPVVFYTSLGLKPDEIAASTSRIFLGVQIQCAQCHNHPFDVWQQKDFWGFAAFFARLQRPPANQMFAFQVVDSPTGEVELPTTKETVAPRFLSGDVPKLDEGVSRRQALADWLTSRDNPYFAKATVNRLWGMMFGKGIVDPIDDFGKHNQPLLPEVLDWLAADFVAHEFDLRRTLRILARTEAYQLSSRSIAPQHERTAFFAQMSVKSLNAEQIYDALSDGTRRRNANAAAMAGNVGFGGFDAERQTFLSKFEAPTAKATEFQAGIPQMLTMINGSLIASAISPERSDLLAAIVDAPFLSEQDRVEILFLSTLARFPSETEANTLQTALQSEEDRKKKEAIYADVLWAILNSAEFLLNH